MIWFCAVLVMWRARYEAADRSWMEEFLLLALVLALVDPRRSAVPSKAVGTVQLSFESFLFDALATNDSDPTTESLDSAVGVVSLVPALSGEGEVRDVAVSSETPTDSLDLAVVVVAVPSTHSGEEEARTDTGLDSSPGCSTPSISTSFV